MRLASRCLMLLSSLLAFQPAQAQEIRVAAAADLKFALDELDAQYEKQAEKRIAVSYGSSGNFFAQIQNGAPFDIFFSADIEYPRKLGRHAAPSRERSMSMRSDGS